MPSGSDIRPRARPLRRPVLPAPAESLVLTLLVGVILGLVATLLYSISDATSWKVLASATMFAGALLGVGGLLGLPFDVPHSFGGVQRKVAGPSMAPRDGRCWPHAARPPAGDTLITPAVAATDHLASMGVEARRAVNRY
jgi:hypothetical protein